MNILEFIDERWGSSYEAAIREHLRLLAEGMGMEYYASLGFFTISDIGCT